MENPLSSLFNGNKDNELLKNPGDKLEARVTKTNRQVIKYSTNEVKYSATRYPSGKTVETKTTNPNTNPKK